MRVKKHEEEDCRNRFAVFASVIYFFVHWVPRCQHYFLFLVCYFPPCIFCWLNWDISSGESKLNIQTLLKTGIWSFGSDQTVVMWKAPQCVCVCQWGIFKFGSTSFPLIQNGHRDLSHILMLAALHSAYLTGKLLFFLLLKKIQSL